LLFPAAGEPAMQPVRPVNGPADRSYLMPARTEPVRTALPGLALAAILLLAGCGWASQETSAAPLTRTSSLCGQVANSRSAGEMGWTRGSSSSASAICRVSSGISAGAAPARPQPPAARLAPSPGLPDPPTRSAGEGGPLPPRHQATSTCVRRSGTIPPGGQQTGVTGEQHGNGAPATNGQARTDGGSDISA
jgi:hypothetical protein